MSRVRSARVVQAVGLLGWALGVAAIVGAYSLLFLLLPAGLLLAAVGLGILADWGQVRRDLHDVQQRWPNRYPPPERRAYWRIYGAAWVFLGVVWAAVGTAAALT